MIKNFFDITVAMPTAAPAECECAKKCEGHTTEYRDGYDKGYKDQQVVGR